MANSPVLWGPNNTAINLQSQETLSTGELIQNDGPRNLIGYNRFENGLTTGWSLGTTGTLTNAIPTGTPTFGSGAAGTLSIAAASTTPIDGTYSLSLASSVATTAGNMLASDALTVQPGLQSKALTFKFSYQAFANGSNGNFSGTSSNSFGIACYDVTNSSWLPVAGNFAMTQGSGVGIATGTMQTNATTASIRFVIYNANASAGAITMYFDDFYLGPQTAPVGPIVTDWVAYTPTIVGFGTPTSVNFQSRRVGSDLEIKGNFQTGTATGTTATITLGFQGGNGNVMTDSTIVANSIVGVAGQAFSATTYFGEYVLAQPSVNTLNFSVQSSTTNAVTAATGTNIGGASFTFEAKVRISGWSSNVQTSNDTDTRVVAAVMSSTSTQSITLNSDTQVTGFTASSDTHGAFSSNAYIVPVSGYYAINASVSWNTQASSARGLTRINVNGSSIFTGQQIPLSASFNITSQANTIAKLNAGDSITIIANTTVTTSLVSGSTWTVNRLSGPAVIATTESVNMKYVNTAGTSFSGGVDTSVPFATKVYDSHNAYNTGTGTYTVPVSGKYQVTITMECASTAYVAGDSFIVFAKNNGTIQSYGPRAAVQTSYTGLLAAAVSMDIQCNAGDAITAWGSNTKSSSLSIISGLNHLEIKRVGN